MSAGHFARSLRLARLFHHHQKRMLIVPLDHAVTTGVPACRGSLDPLLFDLAANGVDAVVLHKGMLRHIDVAAFRDMSLVVHLSASTALGPDPDAKCLVTTVEEAISLGADAVSVHINLGSRDERRQLEDVGSVAGHCDKWNIPLLAMVYPRGPGITNPADPEVVLHAVTVAANLGADLVKTEYAGSVAAMAAVTSACPIPVLAAGGPRLADDELVLSFARDALAGGAAGVALGRNIFMAPSPGALASRIAGLVHQVASNGPVLRAAGQ